MACYKSDDLQHITIHVTNTTQALKGQLQKTPTFVSLSLYVFKHYYICFSDSSFVILCFHFKSTSLGLHSYTCILTNCVYNLYNLVIINLNDICVSLTCTRLRFKEHVYSHSVLGIFDVNVSNLISAYMGTSKREYVFEQIYYYQI